MRQQTYTAVEPIQHDGQRFEPGSAIELPDEHAAPLLVMGHIRTPDEAKAKTHETPPAEQPAAQEASAAACAPTATKPARTRAPKA